MEFKIIENPVDIIDEDKFEYDYFNSPLTTRELRRKYGISAKKFKELGDKIKSKHGLSVRPSKHNQGKHYYPTEYGWSIGIIIDNKRRYLGHVSTEELAKKAVQICKHLNWDIEKCKQAIWELKLCS